MTDLKNIDDMDDDELMRAAEAAVEDENRQMRAAVMQAKSLFRRPSTAVWMSKYELSQEEVDAMQDAEFLIPDLVISSQINLIAAKAGCGKTSILMHACAEIVQKGYELFYVNLDCGAADLKYWREKANQGGFSMITPHFQGGGAIDEWLQSMGEMASQEDADLSKTVIVIDTLKKITDLMSKTKAKQTMELLRALTAKECTIIGAAHCNKHRTPDGKLIFEGVGDIENDCDNLVYLEGSEKDEFGTKTVTTEPSDKVRGIFHKRSWQIHEDRSVEALDMVVDVAGEQQAQSQREKDSTAIAVITEGIQAGNHKRTELFDYARENNISRREFDAVIKRYCRGSTGPKVAPIWRNEKQKSNNSDYYILVS